MRRAACTKLLDWHKSRGAFSLLELSVVIIIVGVIAGVGLSLKQSGAEDCVGATKAQLAVVDAGLRAYVAKHDRFPRPAIRTAGVEDIHYGREATAASLDSNGGVLFGALPFQALELSPSYAGDCWGNKFTYAVTEDLTDTVKFMATLPGPVFEGKITIKSSPTSTVSTSMAYAIISHGLNASGAVKVNYRDPSNTNRAWCTVGSAIETENCDVSNPALVAPAFNDGKDAGVSLFDDVISFGGKIQRVVNGVCAPASGNCAAGSVAVFAPGACGTTDTWNCLGQFGGTNANCTSASAPCAAPENGVCGTTFNTCTNATPAPASAVTGSCGGTDTWTCLGNNGGSNASCSSANTTPCPVDGGWSNCSLPCGGGTRTCTNPAPANGGINCVGSTDCNTQPCPAVVHGACGGISNSCDSGTPVSFTAGNCTTPDTWTCQGANGGGSVSCDISARCDGVCDNSTIDSCSAGYATSQNPGVCGSNATWSCAGINGGSYDSCSRPNASCAAVTAVCWGNDSHGQLGDNSPGTQSFNPREVQGGHVFTQISAGTSLDAIGVSGPSHSCGITSSGQAYCWGSGANGQLGDGQTGSRAVPSAVLGGLTFTQISAGSDHTCAITTNGRAYCWGLGADGRLGDGQTSSRTTPSAVQGGYTFAKISAGFKHTCGVTTSGQGFCWGQGSGELGDGTVGTRTTPRAVGGGHAFVDISAGSLHSCGITTSGSAYCWGRGYNGQIGNSRFDHQLFPALVVGGHRFTQISAGTERSCGIAVGGQALCWGIGYLGNGLSNSFATPQSVSGGHIFAKITAGWWYSCGITTSGQGLCWGLGNDGRLGTGINAHSHFPTSVTGGYRFAQISAGNNHTCAVIAP